ncbi:MAG: cob(I)yrinic acid a,c-diamide adenosyltransferase [Alphaproteobacteria bacterium]|nr:cob(I)yrinic acid a,c-diamide adenosyltransferase [Alphaproteobacteria bacterium]
MVLLSRIYTKSGDKGKTALGDGERIFKDHHRIEAIGEVDETNAFIGWAIQFSEGEEKTLLQKIQNNLFDLGADLCIKENENTINKLRITKEQVTFLETMIDQYNQSLPHLTSFVLPGGTELATALHLARTVVRRAERRVVTLSHKDTINSEIIKYLNRLSDLLFVLARFSNHQSPKTGDILWTPGSN